MRSLIPSLTAWDFFLRVIPGRLLPTSSAHSWQIDEHDRAGERQETAFLEEARNRTDRSESARAAEQNRRQLTWLPNFDVYLNDKRPRKNGGSDLECQREVSARSSQKEIDPKAAIRRPPP